MFRSAERAASSVGRLSADRGDVILHRRAIGALLRVGGDELGLVGASGRLLGRGTGSGPALGVRRGLLRRARETARERRGERAPHAMRACRRARTSSNTIGITEITMIATITRWKYCFTIGSCPKK